MLKLVYFLLYSVSLSCGKFIIVNSNNPKIKPKIKPKTLKSIKMGTAIGSAFGASVPAIKELNGIQKELSNLKARFENDVDELPTTYINHLSSSSHIKADEWNYSKFIDSIYNNNIIGVSVHQDGKFAYVIENTHNVYHTIGLNDIHYVTIIPLHTSTLINMLIDHGVTFDIFN